MATLSLPPVENPAADVVDRTTVKAQPTWRVAWSGPQQRQHEALGEHMTQTDS